MNFSAIQIAFVGVFALLAIGLYGLLVMRNLIKLVIALQILSKAAILALVAAGANAHQINLGQSVALTAIAADTVVAIIALALVMQVHKHFGTLDVGELATLKE